MKRLCYTFIAIILFSCGEDRVLGCFDKEGAIIEREVEVNSFSRIAVFERVKLFIQEGPEYKLLLETGANLIDEVEITVEGDLLSLRDNNSCNLFRDYDVTKVYVTAPNITEIRNSSSLEIASIGELNYPEIDLYSEDNEDSGELYINGDFNLDINSDILRIISNGYSSFKLRGSVDRAFFNLFAGDTRILAENLNINFLHLYHRSSANMVVRPLESIKGEIVGVGDVIALYQPPIVEVEELFEGRLIFE